MDTDIFIGYNPGLIVYECTIPPLTLYFQLPVLFGEGGRNDSRFLLFRVANAVFADAVNTHLHLVDSTRKGFPQVLDIDIEAVRIEAAHLPAAFALKVGVGAVVVIGCQAEVGRPSAGADAFDDTVGDQQVEDSVDRHPVDRAAALEGVVDVSG